jgi:HAD superfamily hydrolase (TIGR01490 family)
MADLPSICEPEPVPKARAAFFDCDGVLRKGNITTDLGARLGEVGFYSRRTVASIGAFLAYHIVENATPTEEFHQAIGELWAEVNKGRAAAAVRRIGEGLFESTMDAVYISSAPLVAMLTRSGYTPVIVSTGATEVVSLVGKHLGIDEIHATSMEVKDGLYTGKLTTNLHMPDGKGELVARMSGRFDLGESFAFADSSTDKGMLEAVGRPVAVNPDKDLMGFAYRKAWPVASHEDIVPIVAEILRTGARQRPVRITGGFH